MTNLLLEKYLSSTASDRSELLLLYRKKNTQTEHTETTRFGFEGTDQTLANLHYSNWSSPWLLELTRDIADLLPHHFCCTTLNPMGQTATRCLLPVSSHKHSVPLISLHNGKTESTIYFLQHSGFHLLLAMYSYFTSVLDFWKACCVGFFFFL